MGRQSRLGFEQDGLHSLSASSTSYSIMANVQAVLSALDVFSRAPDKVALEQANTWLQDFQHSVITPFRLLDDYDILTPRSQSLPV